MIEMGGIPYTGYVVSKEAVDGSLTVYSRSSKWADDICNVSSLVVHFPCYFHDF